MLSVDLVALYNKISKHVEEKRNEDPELAMMFMELNKGVMALMAENADLATQLRELKDIMSQEDALQFNKHWGVWEGESGGEVLHYCPHCKAKNQTVPMQELSNGFRCGSCQNWYQKPEKTASGYISVKKRRMIL